MGGNRKTSATKGGKYMNPTDQARKEDRKKQLKKHKKQREQVREAVIKNKNPNTVLDELAKLDDLEFDTEKACPYADRVMQEKRQRLRSTYFKILEYYKNTNKMEQWKEHQEEFNQYEKERDRKKSLYAAVKKAQNWSVDHIPLPDAPMPDNPFYSMPQAPMGLPPKSISSSGASYRGSLGNKKPPGPPPGPPPAKKNFRRKPNTTDVQSKLLEIAGQAQAQEDDDDPPPPPPGIPSDKQGYQNYNARSAVPQPAVQSHMVPPHISTYQQYQYQGSNQPQGTITAAPQVYKPQAPGSGKTFSSEPQLRASKKGGTTSFLPTALRIGPSKPSAPSQIKNPFTPASLSRPTSSMPKPDRIDKSKQGNTDKAYEKFMREMSSLM